jgi:hypothetical protein
VGGGLRARTRRAASWAELLLLLLLLLGWVQLAMVLFVSRVVGE